MLKQFVFLVKSQSMYSSKYSHLCLKYTFAFSVSIADPFCAKTALECNPGAILLNIKCRICVQSKKTIIFNYNGSNDKELTSISHEN